MDHVAVSNVIHGRPITSRYSLIPVGAYAQSHQDLERATPPPAPDATARIVDPYATAGPKIYVTDASGRLATVTLRTYAVHIIGPEGVVLTDIRLQSERTISFTGSRSAVSTDSTSPPARRPLSAT
jgi:hypothetical protein